MDYVYNGAFINFLQEYFGWDFAHFALRNQNYLYDYYAGHFIEFYHC